ncbi:uncharacterized protein LOC102803712 [Saccoglossus kowalevskii]|uniref:Kappa-type opioid receptor-like n=1 Tax=Saccoglossus kowalevskii TaxID=10224 RepID=A0ABM0LZW4_SACKO|nr:PREDICTED: kappa-type opioid receptor-like [Saccoglossus kowalevskii]
MASNISDNITYDDDNATWEELGTIGIVLQSGMLIILCITGCLGNLLTITVILKYNDMQSATNILIANLALSDFVVCLLSEPFFIVGVVLQRWPFNDALCVAVGEITIMSFHTSVLTLLCIAINRYYVIMKSPTLTQRYFTTQKTILMCCGTWMFALTTALPSVFGWGRIKYAPDISVCLLDFNPEDFTFILVLTIIFGVIPFIAVTACYISIYYTVHKKTKMFTKSVQPIQKKENISEEQKEGSSSESKGNSIQENNTNGIEARNPHSEVDTDSNDAHTTKEPTSKCTTLTEVETNNIHGSNTFLQNPISAKVQKKRSTPKLNSQQIKMIEGKRRRESTVAANLFLVTLVFCICWLPLGIVALIASKHDISRPILILNILLAYSNNSLNTFLYAWRNSNLRKAYRNLLMSEEHTGNSSLPSR